MQPVVAVPPRNDDAWYNAMLDSSDIGSLLMVGFDFPPNKEFERRPPTACTTHMLGPVHGSIGKIPGLRGGLGASLPLIT